MSHKGLNVSESLPKVSTLTRVTLRDASTGEIREEVVSEEDVLVDVGRRAILDLLGGVSGVLGITHGAIGTTATAESQTQTTLAAEVGRRAVALYSRSSSTATWETFYEASFPSGTFTINETGLFGNGATLVANSGTMFFRKTFPAVTKDNTLTLTIQHVVQWP